MDVIAILSITLALIAYGLISRKIEGSILTGPILFTVFGLVAGPAAFGLMPLQMGNEALHLLAEVTLILVLFSDAAHIDLAQLRRDHNLPVRMLLLGIPLTIALGAVAACVKPIHLSLFGTGIKPVTSAFLSWFGPRGLASILFVLLILEEAELANETSLFAIVTVTVTLSVALHGMSAGPAARWYGLMTQRFGECEENRPVGDEPFVGTPT